MAPEKVFRIASLVLLGALVVMRGYFSLRVRQAGERLLPDREAVEREGKGVFLLRVVSFFVLIGILVSYASDLPWVVVLSFPLPVFLRWTGFAIGVAAVLLWTWTQAALRTAWSPQLQLRQEHHLVTTGPYSRVRHPLYTATMCFGSGFAHGREAARGTESVSRVRRCSTESLRYRIAVELPRNRSRQILPRSRRILALGEQEPHVPQDLVLLFPSELLQVLQYLHDERALFLLSLWRRAARVVRRAEKIVNRGAEDRGKPLGDLTRRFAQAALVHADSGPAHADLLCELPLRESFAHA